MSYGSKSVGLSFNPSGDKEVHKCKTAFAAIIDALDGLRKKTTSAEVARMASISITEAQTAQMWAVKALTWKD